jgi:4-diphosphocytidyl-2-C-methyl-D-erythritol kinase
MLRERAPAKVNLTLHVLGRRADGYHELDSLVAFAGVGDELRLEPNTALALDIAGPGAAACGPLGDNLVLRAGRALEQRRPGLQMGRFTLVKRLPVAAGLGGGSSDAAAALRLLARLNTIDPGSEDLHEAARATGADVPVCLAGKARRMTGIGDRLGQPLALPPLFAVLVNPRVGVATAAVFAAMGLARDTRCDAPPAPDWPAQPTRDGIIAALQRGYNDMQAAATGLAPVIGTVISALAATPGCRLARMSGSGATCFGLFDHCHAAAQAARLLSSGHPDWWVRPTLLR